MNVVERGGVRCLASHACEREWKPPPVPVRRRRVPFDSDPRVVCLGLNNRPALDRDHGSPVGNHVSPDHPAPGQPRQQEPVADKILESDTAVRYKGERICCSRGRGDPLFSAGRPGLGTINFSRGLVGP